MSSSDNGNDQFEPLTVGSLETLNEEISHKTEETEPDFNRFKALFDISKFEEDESYVFEAIFDEKKEQEEIVFKPLIDRKEKPFHEDGKVNEAAEQEKESLAVEEPEKPEPTPEEKGYKEGFEKGHDKGFEEGKTLGYEEGYKKGEAKGLEKGEQEGHEKGQAKGLEQGLKEGEEKGLKEAQEKAVDILNSLEESLRSADMVLDDLVETYEERIISLIQQIAKKVILSQIEINDEIVRNMVLDTLKQLVEPEEITLSVSPEDYEYIEMVKEDFFEQIDSLNSISVQSDPSIQRGGCRVETSTASVSADAEAKLEAIFEAMKTAGA